MATRTQEGRKALERLRTAAEKAERQYYAEEPTMGEELADVADALVVAAHEVLGADWVVV